MEHRDDNLTTADLADSGGTSETQDEETTADDAVEPTDEGRDDDGQIETPAPTDSTQERDADGDSGERTALLPDDQSAEFKGRWETLQTGFVDEPRRAVEDADALVAELMQRLASSFSDERSSLEEQWDRGDDVSTEDLRVALQRYRSFFERLLSA
jgi:hypothetical protein